jgi:hypothetical protein
MLTYHLVLGVILVELDLEKLSTKDLIELLVTFESMDGILKQQGKNDNDESNK